MTLINRINPRLIVWGIILLFGAVYVSISLYNHYNYRTFAYDLGIKNQALWDYAHGHANLNTVMWELDGKVNVLANHFEPVLLLFAPLYYIFGSYTLLVVQIFFVLLGGFGAYKYVLEISGDKLLGTLALAMFYSMWGVFAAVGFDFHTNVIGAVVVPWIFWGIEKRITWVWVSSLIFVLLCKENMALWMAFVGVGMALHWRKEKNKRNRGLLITAVSGVYFFVIMKFAMPSLADGKLPYLHFNYSALGASWTEALKTVFTRPGYVFTLMFENQIEGGDVQFNDDAKIQLHAFIFLTGGIFLLFKPQFLIMLVPIYAQKLFSDDPLKWSVFQQYSIEFVPIIVLASFSYINQWNNKIAKLLAGCLLVFATVDTTKEFLGLWSPLSYRNSLTKFYSPNHYHREIDRKEINELVNNVPSGVSVSASFYMVPHLANRKEIYQFPSIQNAEYIVVANDGSYCYPLEVWEFQPKIDSLIGTGLWSEVKHTEHGYLLKRINE